MKNKILKEMKKEVKGWKSLIFKVFPDEVFKIYQRRSTRWVQLVQQKQGKLIDKIRHINLQKVIEKNHVS